MQSCFICASLFCVLQDVKVFSEDGTSKVVEILTDMTARDLCQLLVYKSHCVDDNSWTLVEHHPQLGLGRGLVAWLGNGTRGPLVLVIKWACMPQSNVNVSPSPATWGGGSKLLCVPSDPCFLPNFTLPPSQSSPSDTLRISPWVLKAVASQRLSLGDRFSRTWFFSQSLGVLGAHWPTELQLPISEQLSLFIDRREPWFPGVATERQILIKGSHRSEVPAWQLSETMPALHTGTHMSVSCLRNKGAFYTIEYLKTCTIFRTC